jgi:prophage regulatory protein
MNNPSHATAFIRLPEVKRRTGLGKTTIYDWMRQERFPKSLSLGGNITVWVESEVDAWVEARLADREGGVATAA